MWSLFETQYDLTFIDPAVVPLPSNAKFTFRDSSGLLRPIEIAFE